MNVNVAFCRSVLREVHADVKAILPRVNLKKDAWVINTVGGWEFQITSPSAVAHGLVKFYWYGHADNAYDARSKGWSAYLERYHRTELGAVEASRNAGANGAA